MLSLIFKEKEMNKHFYNVSAAVNIPGTLNFNK